MTGLPLILLVVSAFLAISRSPRRWRTAGIITLWTVAGFLFAAALMFVVPSPTAPALAGHVAAWLSPMLGALAGFAHLRKLKEQQL